ncbi:hypothetical protein ST37_08305 [Vibrio sp. qd031]|uniref:DUF5681 domain-containing protein n=1 Tax=Vibrio sp. qd031 TaxID=1603038 RepID=UPI000A111373|nr:DUF5681 domain-containing protein [Vibrio sp. qd031]ORT50711.1 hypothetical protein ST37_08305 [Vibrio sp. qd031]
MAFKKGESGNPKGRPKNSKNKREFISEKVQSKAVKRLEDAVEEGEQWAIIEVLKRVAPPLKPITAPDSLDADMLRARIFELVELEQRLKALEDESADS